MRRRRNNFQKYLPYLFKALIIISLTAVFWWFIFLSSFFELRHIQIKNANSVSADKIRASFHDSLKNSSFLFESNNLFYALLKKNALKNKVQKKFPVFKQTTITPKVLTDEIEAKFKERNKLAILRQNDSPNFYFDEQGILFGEAPEYEGRLITLVETKKSEFKQGDRLGPVDLRKSIMVLLKSDYLQKDLNLSKISIEAQGKELHVQILDGARLEFSISNAPLKVSNEIALLKQVMEKRVKSKRDQLKYIDLRVENRAYIQYEEGS